ncbi:hypothetical protein V6N11_071488 [Hibiscus sabdariffa]|uniref:Uncharacterized protein n=1 Tax=Hibiscus sabdariffa TaxID=183260 RepID=A0ABR2U077_9ROSI
MIERALNIRLCHEEHVLNDNQHDMEDVVGCEDQDEEYAIVVAGTQLGDADANHNEFNWNLDCFTTTRSVGIVLGDIRFENKRGKGEKTFDGGNKRWSLHQTIQIRTDHDPIQQRVEKTHSAPSPRP